MAKITKRAEILDTLHTLVAREATQNQTKVAELAQTNVSGVPCKDTKVTSVSEATETTDQNNVGPDKLNNEQGYEQKPTSDKSEPVATAKSASEVTSADIDKVAANILSQIQKTIEDGQKKAELAQTNVSGKPGKDTKIQSVSDKTEHTDQNAVGPEKLNKEQGYDQKDSKDKSEPVANAKKAEDAQASLDKKASYDMGSAFCEALVKRAAHIQELEQKQAEEEMIKEAGRRDLDTLIAQAAAELEAQQKQAEESDKLAEYQGALAFDELYKQAQFDALIEENNQLKVKIASYQEIEKTAAAAQVAKDKESEITKIAALVTEHLKRELSATAAVK